MRKRKEPKVTVWEGNTYVSDGVSNFDTLDQWRTTIWLESLSDDQVYNEVMQCTPAWELRTGCVPLPIGTRQEQIEYLRWALGTRYTPPPIPDEFDLPRS